MRQSGLRHGSTMYTGFGGETQCQNPSTALRVAAKTMDLWGTSLMLKPERQLRVRKSKILRVQFCKGKPSHHRYLLYVWSICILAYRTGRTQCGVCPDDGSWQSRTGMVVRKARRAIPSTTRTKRRFFEIWDRFLNKMQQIVCHGTLCRCENSVYSHSSAHLRRPAATWRHDFPPGSPVQLDFGQFRRDASSPLSTGLALVIVWGTACFVEPAVYAM